jgi:signal transduction histidine kinase
LPDASQSGDEFLGLLSHELRLPLTVIHGYAQLLGKKLGRKGLVDEALYADLIREQTSRLERMMTDLVEVGRLESGTFELHSQSVALRNLIVRAVTRVSSEQRTSSVQHTVDLSVEPEQLDVWGDERRLDQVLAHLITNAMRYSPNGGNIRVSARPSTPRGQVRVNVADCGVGIPLDERAHIFDRGFRGARARKIVAHGLGLGLYISRRIIEAHGGVIGMDAEPDATGSSFWFTLPVRSQSDL